MILAGNCMDTLQTIESESVQCVVTSPPYWGLRDYGVDGQFGLESTPEEYVRKIVEVFHHVRRSLKKDGVLWLNLGDSYSGSVQGWGKDKQYAGTKQATNRGSLNRHEGMKNKTGIARPVNYISSCQDNGLKPKDLVGIPWRVALALQADGWYLRSDIIWSKPNPMPESVTDRPTKAHEYIFLLTKSERYFYNADAIKEPAIYGVPNSPESIKSPYGQGFTRANGFKELPEGQGNIRKARDKQRGHGRRHNGFNDRWDLMSKTEQCSGLRNKRSVWEISPQPFPEAHFATFPEDIPTICIKAGSKQGDIVLDPFSGSGTVGVVAKRLGREFIGCELNPKYVEMAERRIAKENPPLLVEP